MHRGNRAKGPLTPGLVFEMLLAHQRTAALDRAACLALLKKVHTCLRPGGRAATFEFVPNEDLVSPPMPAAFAMTSH